eukprot:15433936-Alexandrium_andersonii.AAC.1
MAQKADDDIADLRIRLGNVVEHLVWSSRYKLVGGGTCIGVDFTAAELNANYSSLPSQYGGGRWYADGSGYGTGTCPVRSFKKCAAICDQVAGCQAFSTSTTH